MTVKKYLNFQGQAVILVMELSFDNETGVFCKEWQTLQPNGKEHDVRLLPADDLIELAREIQQTLSSNRNGQGAFASQWRSVNH